MSSFVDLSVILAGSAAIGRPPELPMRSCTSSLSVMLMNFAARSLRFEFSGMTHRLPEEPTTFLLCGKVENVTFVPFMSFWKRPYHQVPEKNIG